MPRCAGLRRVNARGILKDSARVTSLWPREPDLTPLPPSRPREGGAHSLLSPRSGREGQGMREVRSQVPRIAAIAPFPTAGRGARAPFSPRGRGEKGRG